MNLCIFYAAMRLISAFAAKEQIDAANPNNLPFRLVILYKIKIK